MSLLQSLLGNVVEIAPDKAQTEFQPMLVEGESVVKAFKLFRDVMVMTNLRIMSLDKQGLTGTKQEITSIPYASIKKFSKESAGFLDFDAELRIWLAGESEPMKWEFSREVDVNEVYRLLSQYVLASH